MQNRFMFNVMDQGIHVVDRKSCTTFVLTPNDQAQLADPMTWQRLAKTAKGKALAALVVMACRNENSRAGKFARLCAGSLADIDRDFFAIKMAKSGGVPPSFEAALMPVSVMLNVVVHLLEDYAEPLRERMEHLAGDVMPRCAAAVRSGDRIAFQSALFDYYQAFVGLLDLLADDGRAYE